MSKEDFVKSIVEAAEESGYTIRSYSGRGMYGKKCLGVEVERGQSVLDVPVKIIQNICPCNDGDTSIDIIDYYDEVAECLLGAQMDSLGMDNIVYWPKLEYEG